MRARVLIIGGSGMFGHRAWLTFRDRFDTWVTLRSTAGVPRIFDFERVLAPVDVRTPDSVEQSLRAAKPDVVVNCVGVVKQLPLAKDPLVSLSINSMFPHQLSAMCRREGARLIHLSTDCVFSGRKGMYSENECADAEDLYGRTKLLGEVTSDGALTVRTSIIGREMRTTTGLVEWLLSHRGGRISGFKRAIFSGLTTQALAGALADVIDHHAGLSGLYHVAADPISKYDLLCRINEHFGAGITIDASDAVQIDRSLNGERFKGATGITAPPWDQMIAALAADPTPYDEWRQNVVS